MALTATTSTQLYQFFVVAFGAAPGVTYMNQLAAASDSGMTVKDIVNVFTQKPQFTSVYPTFLTNAAFAAKIVENVVGDSATAAAKAEAAADIVAAINSGYSRGDVVYQIFSNLAAKPVTDAKWGATSEKMANQVAVAQYFTETMLVDTEDLSVLRSVVAGVDEDTDVSTPAKIADVINAVVNPAPVTYALTVSPSTVTEGDTGTKLLFFTLNLDKPAAEDTTINYEIVGGTATAGDDFQVTAGAVVIEKGQSVALVNVVIVDDTIDEISETVQLRFFGEDLAADVTSTSTIVDNDNTAPTITSAATGEAVAENGVSGAAVYTITATDIDTSALVYSIGGTDAAKFSVNSATGVVSIKDPANYEAQSSYSITVAASDGVFTTTQAVTIPVSNVNEAPTVTATQSVAGTEDTSLTFTVVGSDVDANTTLTYTAAGATKGVVSGGTGGVFTYTPTENANGTDTLTVTVSDGALTATQSVTINLAAVNDAPVAVAASGSVAEDATLTGALVATDVDADTLTYSLVAGATGFAVTSDGAFTFDAATYDALGSGDTQTVTGTFQVTDGVATDTETITVTITGANDAPVVAADTASVVRGNTITIDVLTNDTDVDGDTLSLVTATAENGTVSIQSGMLVFSADEGYVGPATVTYVATDGNVNVTGTVSVGVLQPTITSPMANEGDALSFTINGAPNTSYVIELGGSATAGVDYTAPSGTGYQTVTTDADGVAALTLTTIRDRSTEGTETVTAKIIGTSPAVTATGTISDVSLNNVAPTIDAVSTVATNEGTTATVTVTTADVNIDDDTITVSVGSATNGTVSYASGVASFVPTADFNGSGSFVITATDEAGLSTTQTVTVNVAQVNDAVVLSTAAQAVTTNEGATATFTVTATDVDTDVTLNAAPQTLTYSVAIDPFNGTVTVDATGNGTYVPTGDFNGTDSFIIAVTDSSGSTVNQEVTVSVAQVNDAPVGADIAAQTVEQEDVFTLNVAPFFSDVDIAAGTNAVPQAALTYTAAGLPSWATLNATTGVITGTPTNVAAIGVTAVTVTATDADGATASETFNLTVTSAYSVAASTVTSVDEGSTVTYTITNTERAFGDVLDYVINPVSGVTAADFAQGLQGQAVFNSSGQATITISVVNDNLQEVAADNSNESFSVAFVYDGVTAAIAPTLDIEDQTFAGTLTVAEGDLVTGTESADTFSGNAGVTLSSGDYIDGLGGEDTLFIRANGTNPSVTILENVENVNIQLRTGQTIDTQDWDSVSGITVLSDSFAGHTLTLQDLEATTQISVLESTTTVELDWRDLTGAADNLRLRVEGATGVTFEFTDTEQFESTTLTVSGTVGVNISAGAMGGTLDIVGDGALTLDLLNTTVSAIDASGYSGAATYTVSAADTTTFTGGNSGDTITFATGSLSSADTVDGGAGTDTIITELASATTTTNALDGVHNFEIATINVSAQDSAVVLNVSGISDTVSITGDASASLTVSGIYASDVNVTIADVSAMRFDFATGAGNLDLDFGSANATASLVVSGATSVDVDFGNSQSASVTDFTLSTATSVDITASGADITFTTVTGAAINTVSLAASSASATVTNLNVASGDTVTIDATNGSASVATLTATGLETLTINATNAQAEVVDIVASGIDSVVMTADGSSTTLAVLDDTVRTSGSLSITATVANGAEAGVSGVSIVTQAAAASLTVDVTYGTSGGNFSLTDTDLVINNGFNLSASINAVGGSDATFSAGTITTEASGTITTLTVNLGAFSEITMGAVSGGVLSDVDLDVGDQGTITLADLDSVDAATIELAGGQSAGIIATEIEAGGALSITVSAGVGGSATLAAVSGGTLSLAIDGVASSIDVGTIVAAGDISTLRVSGTEVVELASIDGGSDATTIALAGDAVSAGAIDFVSGIATFTVNADGDFRFEDISADTLTSFTVVASAVSFSSIDVADTIGTLSFTIEDDGSLANSAGGEINASALTTLDVNGNGALTVDLDLNVSSIGTIDVRTTGSASVTLDITGSAGLGSLDFNVGASSTVAVSDIDTDATVGLISGVGGLSANITIGDLNASASLGGLDLAVGQDGTITIGSAEVTAVGSADTQITEITLVGGASADIVLGEMSANGVIGAVVITVGAAGTIDASGITSVSASITSVELNAGDAAQVSAQFEADTTIGAILISGAGTFNDLAFTGSATGGNGIASLTVNGNAAGSATLTVGGDSSIGAVTIGGSAFVVDGLDDLDVIGNVTLNGFNNSATFSDASVIGTITISDAATGTTIVDVGSATTVGNITIEEASAAVTIDLRSANDTSVTVDATVGASALTVIVSDLGNATSAPATIINLNDGDNDDTIELVASAAGVAVNGFDFGSSSDDSISLNSAVFTLGMGTAAGSAIGDDLNALMVSAAGASLVLASAGADVSAGTHVIVIDEAGLNEFTDVLTALADGGSLDISYDSAQEIGASSEVLVLWYDTDNDRTQLTLLQASSNAGGDVFVSSTSYTTLITFSGNQINGVSGTFDGDFGI